MDKYDHAKIEKKWQDKWEAEKLYVADIKKGKNPFYNLWMFPYPSAEGLHAGHAFASTGSDVYGRFMRMQGREVFQPIGYDSFGIHSENYAIKINEDPHEVVKRTTKNYERQMRSLGHGYDWTRTVTTSDPDYYKWTQWLFLTMFKAGLAYKRLASVNFCPSCKTVLADEQVMTPKQAGKEAKDASGKIIVNSEELKVCERCGTVVEKRDLDQWFMRITDYAERLLNGLKKIDWSERVKLAQKEWIGKNKGLNIEFEIKNLDLKITIWTKFWETVFGTTFLVLAPEHNLLKQLNVPNEHKKEVDEYIQTSLSKSEYDRENSKEKTGVFTGVYVINPVNGQKVPLWVADYVLASVGTGAVMGVPAHDERDFDFAKKYHLDIVQVVEYADKNINEKVKNAEISFEGEGKLINSGKFDGMDAWGNGKEKMAEWMIKEDFANWLTTHHLRDWLVSRQRYWGAPIPMIYCKTCAEKGYGYLAGGASRGAPKSGFPLVGGFGADEQQDPLLIHNDASDWDYFGWWPEENLPVLLPPMKEYKPDGSAHGPLHHHPEFFNVKCPHCGSAAERETDVMDTFVDSSWYFLRYPSVGLDKNSKISKVQDSKQISSSKIKNSLGIGNRELEIPWNLEISKRWLPVNLYFGGAEHSVLHLMYARFINMTLSDLGYLSHDEPFPRFFAHGLMIKDGAKMSKSRGNVVNPDEYVKKFGADTLRMYEMFLGPMDGYPDFRDSGIEGMQRFLGRVWRLFQMANDKSQMTNGEVLSKLHLTIKGVTEDIKEFKYNTAIAKIMRLVNLYTEYKIQNTEYLKPLALLLAPFAPHMTEEVWVEVLHEPFSIHKASWPSYDATQIVQDEATIVIQINGKVRSQLIINNSQCANKEEIEELAKKDEKIAKLIGDQEIKKVVFIPGKLINFVI